MIPNIADEEKSPLGFWKEAFGYTIDCNGGSDCRPVHDRVPGYQRARQHVDGALHLRLDGNRVGGVHYVHHARTHHSLGWWDVGLPHGNLRFAPPWRSWASTTPLNKFHPALVSTVQHLEIVVAMFSSAHCAADDPVRVRRLRSAGHHGQRVRPHRAQVLQGGPGHPTRLPRDSGLADQMRASTCVYSSAWGGMYMCVCVQCFPALFLLQMYNHWMSGSSAFVSNRVVGRVPLV